ncbi:MAG: hypothetical protein AAFU49_18985 [Pseudomonadota bacterium]
MTAAGARMVFALAVALVAALAVRSYFLVAADGGYHFIDDPVITLRVARNVAVYGVPYFNPGEAVAANTSLVWPLLLAPLYLVVSDVETALYVAFVGSSLAWIALSAGVALQFDDLALRIATLATLALGPWALLYGGSAWEHVPQTILVTLAFLIYLKGPETARTGLIAFWLIALSFLIRPDSAALVTAFWLVMLFRLSGTERTWFLMRSLPAVLLPLGYVAGMLWFYGSPVPNTYHLKVGSSEAGLMAGIRYLLDPSLSGPVPAMILATALFWRGLKLRERAVLTLAVVQTLYITSVGGDIFALGRFFLLLLPVLTVILFTRIVDKAGRIPVLLLASVAVIFPVVHPGFKATWQGQIAITHSQVELMQVIGAVITPSDGSVGLHRLGLGYHLPEHHIVDFLGKADPVIARQVSKGGPIGHNKWDYGHSLSAYDVVAAPVKASGHEQVLAGSVSDAPTRSDWSLMARAFIETGRYAYIAPERFCFPTVFGLYLDERFAGRLDALERLGADGKLCIP